MIVCLRKVVCSFRIANVFSVAVLACLSNVCCEFRVVFFNVVVFGSLASFALVWGWFSNVVGFV